MVDRTTYLQNALYQIQEKGNSTRAVDIPPDTQERHVKNVRVFVYLRPVLICVGRLRRSPSLPRPLPPTSNSG